MKNFTLLFSMLMFFLVSSAIAQTLQDYVLQTKGDTLVVKDDYDYNGQNTLYSLMNADTNAPAGRVYELHNGGVYSLVNVPTSSATKKTIIMGPTQTSLKVNKGDPPPILQGAVYQGGSSTGGLNSGYDLLVKNVDVEIGNSAGGEGWAFFGFAGPGMRIEVDNSIIEHNWWTVIGGPQADENIFFKDDYFVNLDGHTCHRNGGVIDFNNPNSFTEDTLLVENCTHVNAQGTLYKWRTGYTVKRSIFNHNDFIDCAGYVFMNTGDHANITITNNIFVNTCLQPYSTAIYYFDGAGGEVDPDNLPMGLVNVRDDSAFQANGASFYVDKNLIYWDPSLSDIAAHYNNAKINNVTDWTSQMITMNTRSQSMFDDNAKYPLLTEGTWIKNELPNFKNTDVLFTTQLAIIKTYVLSCDDTTYTGSLPSWRQSSNPESQYFTYADWPIPIDLSYDNSDLLTAGLNGFPVGDLDWFPTQYASWKAQEGAELAQINTVLTTGVTAVENTQELPRKFQLMQNYPNPFNPTTVISYTVPKAANVTLKVYDLLGNEVATLVNGYKAAQEYHVNFNASNLASGVYIYQLKYGNQSITKKMVLLK